LQVFSKFEPHISGAHFIAYSPAISPVFFKRSGM